MPRSLPKVSLEQVRRLWFSRQGLLEPRGSLPFTRSAVTRWLESVGALQLDSINVLERAHYLTLWSRFGDAFDRRRFDRWVYRDRIGYEYWGHEASILPISHFPLGKRRMAGYPPPHWRTAAWWQRYQTSTASKRRVLRRLRAEGPLESSAFERDPDEFGGGPPPGGTIPYPKEDKRSLQLYFHAGRVAVRDRRHFRRVYDLAENVYPELPAASRREYEDSWLLQGLRGNGIAPETHLEGYFTAPKLKAAERRRVIARNLAAGRITEVAVEGFEPRCYALPELLDGIDRLEAPRGTHLICPFDSLLWQRRRAEELLGFRYRIEIYIPAPRREFGYYVLPILHDGRFVGRFDPKLHRDEGRLEIRSLHFEPGFRRTRKFEGELDRAFEALAAFCGAQRIERPR